MHRTPSGDGRMGVDMDTLGGGEYLWTMRSVFTSCLERCGSMIVFV